ncbi:MAG: DNA polymerase IV [Dehalococcoidia bacterium]|nr:DNA polymerase IV [Dehalococcoidia bacterium]
MADTTPTLPRRIAHFDLDSFFVAVERARDPSLLGKPVLVGGYGRRGVVATASYEARQFGCHSAQPMAVALRLCPQAIVVPANFEAYQETSKRFHVILADASPVVESGGIDEAYVDLTGIGPVEDGARAAAVEVRRRTREELHCPVSVCIAGSRTTAKTGSDQAKPDGLIEVPVGGDAAFLAPLDIGLLPLVGPKLADGLRRVGVRTVGQAAKLDPKWLEQQFGRAGQMLAERARGIDPTPVRAGGRPNRSISREVTFGTDVTDPAELRQVLRRHAERVGADLRRANRRARTVTLKLRWDDFTTLTRSHTLDRPAQSTPALLEAGVALLDGIFREHGVRPVRLIGLGATNLVEDQLQLALEDAAGGGPLRDERLDGVLDAIRSKFGDASVRRGTGTRAKPR